MIYDKSIKSDKHFGALNKQKEVPNNRRVFPESDSEAVIFEKTKQWNYLCDSKKVNNNNQKTRFAPETVKTLDKTIYWSDFSVPNKINKKQ